MQELNYTFNYKHPQTLAGKRVLNFLLSPFECACFSFMENTQEVEQLSHIVFKEKLETEGELNDMLEAVYTDLQLAFITFDAVYVGLVHQRFTMAPKSFVQSNGSALFEFVNGASANDSIKQQTLRHETIFIFGMALSTQQILERWFRNVRFTHSGCLAITFKPQLAPPDLYMLAVVHVGYLEISIHQHYTFVFYNCFSWQTNEDVLYYLLYVSEQWQLNPALHSVYLAGNFSTDSSLALLLQTYLAHLKFINASSYAPMKTEQQLPAHYYFTLKHIHTCVF